MNKIIVKILVVAVACGVLAAAMHWMTMASGMDDGMSTDCATVCLTQGDSAPAVAPIAGAILCLAVGFFVVAMATVVPAVTGKLFFENVFQKDRHRYLMKTMVMLR